MISATSHPRTLIRKPSRRRAVVSCALAVLTLGALTQAGWRTAADPAPAPASSSPAPSSPAKPAKPESKPSSPLCGSPSDHKGCPAGEDEAPDAADPGGAGTAAASVAPAVSAQVHDLPAGKPWRIQGDLSEACTCAVPCTCNFGMGPSPHHFCHAIFSLDIQKGQYGEVDLGGLRLAAGNASKGTVWYLDERATPAQEEAMRVIARTIDAKLVAYWKGVDPKIVEDPQFSLLGFKKAKIVQEVGEKANRLQIGTAGSFESDYLMGIDGKTPIVLENNWSWNILHGIKAQTRKLAYRDEYGNRIEASSTNANQGRFDWSDQTPLYLR